MCFWSCESAVVCRTKILVILSSFKQLNQCITDMRRLTTALRSEKCVVRRFRRCANVYLHKPR